MKKKQLFAAAFIAVFACLAGCDANGEEAGSPTPTSASTLEVTITDTPTQTTGDLFTPVEDDVIYGEDLEGSQLVVDNTENSDMKKYNSFNQKMEGARSPSLFCVDGTTGITYFVNQSQDWYIYAIKEDEVTLVVELPAQELTVWEGKLYFIINDYDMYELEGIQSGDIYVYEPETGAVEPVYVAGEKTDKRYVDSSELAVNENGIYFHCTTGMEVMEYNGQKYNVLQTEDLHLPFGAAEPVEDILSMTTPGWREYCFSGGVYQELVKRSEGRRTDAERKETGIQTKNCAILEDELFYKTGNDIGIINLETGEQTVYALEDDIKEMQEQMDKGLEAYLNTTITNKEERTLPGLGEFTVTEDDIWCIVGMYMMRINRQNGEVAYYIVEGERQFLEKLYTDGKQIYGAYVVDYVGGKKYAVVKILTEKEPKLHEVYQLPVLEVQKLIQ